MVTLHMNVDRCKSCGYCILACPSKALKLSGSLNKEGYDVVENDESKCTKCGICYAVCPDNVFELYE